RQCVSDWARGSALHDWITLRAGDWWLGRHSVPASVFICARYIKLSHWSFPVIRDFLGLLGHRGASLLQVWTNPPFSTANPDALSYPLRVIGDCNSALIEFVDTPPLLGREFRFLSSITFNSKCQIVRWIDYWDGRSSQTHIPIGSFGPYPPDFHDGVVNASDTIKKVAQALQNAFALNDPAKAAQLFTPDAVFEDMALHTRVE